MLSATTRSHSRLSARVCAPARSLARSLVQRTPILRLLISVEERKSRAAGNTHDEYPVLARRIRAVYVNVFCTSPSGKPEMNHADSSRPSIVNFALLEIEKTP